MFSLIQPTSLETMAAASQQQDKIFDTLHEAIATVLGIPNTDILTILERNIPVASRAENVEGVSVMPNLIIKMNTSDFWMILFNGKKLKNELERAWVESGLEKEFSIEIWICWFPIWGHAGLPI